MSKLVIHQIPVLNDNYVYLAHEPETGTTAVVDPAVSGPALKAAKDKGWRLTHILNTHHHPDHVGGNLEIKAATGCTIVGPRADEARIPGIDVVVGDGEIFALGNAEARVYDVPGHTRAHCAHEYTQANARFALSVDPGNADPVARAGEIDRMRARSEPTVPSTLGEECATNPFLRADSPDLKAALGLDRADDVAVFAETRHRRDVF